MGRRIRLYGLRHLRDGSAADDLTQQVLVSMLETLRAGRLRDPDKLASFVLGTCRMTILDQRRGAQRRARLLEQFGHEFATVVGPPDPPTTHERLAPCVQALPERERTVLVMTVYEEQASTEVAELLGVSQGNVRVIRHRALARLRECLGVL